ncbi:MAG TPA: peptide chain release factor N(5)-glutamine methyltransferase [Casimicrobiaceae bacterium]|jgi:release factor glutamine methyltransferase
MMITVGQALAQSGLVPVDAQVLLAYVIGNTRAWLTAHADELLTPNEAARFFSLARRRRDGEPIAYLTGLREFWGLSLLVTQNVMIPRPETEALVERSLARFAADRVSHVLDLGTGSGAIALALASERPQAQFVATDVSEAALRVADANARRLGLYNVRFVRADWYDGLGLPAEQSAFDMIVSNPPYIAAGDRHLGQGDLRFEPMAALTPGGNGLSALSTIIAGAPRWLASGGWLIIEHGYDQQDEVRTLFESAGFIDLESTRDLAGIPRVCAGMLPVGRQ